MVLISGLGVSGNAGYAHQHAVRDDAMKGSDNGLACLLALKTLGGVADFRVSVALAAMAGRLGLCVLMPVVAFVEIG